MKTLKYLIPILIMMSGCGSGSQSTDVDDDVPEEVLMQGITEVSGETMQNIIENISSPVEIAALIKDMGIPFNKDYLASTSGVSRYTMDVQKAMALGVFGADLGYLNMYGRTGSVLENLSTIRDLANDLKLGQFFDFSTLKRLASSKSNLDSLMYISVHSFNEMDKYLRNNKRSSLSALMIAGVWLEGLYLITQVYEKHPDKKLSEKIGEQKIMLDNLVIILKNYSNDENFNAITEQILTIKTHFSEVKISIEMGEPEAVEKDGRLMIIQNEKSVVNISEETLKKISKATSEVRSNLINLSK